MDKRREMLAGEWYTYFMRISNIRVSIFVATLSIIALATLITTVSAHAQEDNEAPSGNGLLLEAYVLSGAGIEERTYLDREHSVLPGTVVNYDVRFFNDSMTSVPDYEFRCAKDEVTSTGKFTLNKNKVYEVVDLKCTPTIEGYLSASVSVFFNNTVTSGSSLVYVGVPKHVSPQQVVDRANGISRMPIGELIYFLIAIILSVYAWLIYVNRPRG